MSTDVAKPMTFEDRIAARVKEAAADLITDDDLKAIVARGIDRALFQPRSGPDPYGYGRTATKPALVDELVEKHVEERMREAVGKWLAENPDAIDAAMKNAINTGVAAALISAMDNRFAGIFDIGVSNLQHMGLLPQTG